jgi:hypothetical protein
MGSEHQMFSWVSKIGFTIIAVGALLILYKIVMPDVQLGRGGHPGSPVIPFGIVLIAFGALLCVLGGPGRQYQ